MTKKKITVIAIAGAIVLIAIVTLLAVQLNRKPSPAPIEPVSDTSSAPSSSPISSDFDIPEIIPPTPVPSSKPESKIEEIKVTGSPDGGSATSSVSSEAAAPHPTSSKPQGGASSAKPSKPTGDGDVYDERTGTYPKLGDTMTSPKTGDTLVWVAEKPSGGPGWVGAEVQSQPEKGGEPGIPLDENGNIIYDPAHDIGAD